MDLKLTGKRALVTAASRGLGYATALGLACEGVALVICSRDEARITDAAARIRTETGARVEALVADRPIQLTVVAHGHRHQCVAIAE